MSIVKPVAPLRFPFISPVVDFKTVDSEKNELDRSTEKIFFFRSRLKRFEDETYEFEGFTLAVDASQTEIDSFNTANNCNSISNKVFSMKQIFFRFQGSQSALNENDGSYIFCQIARLFCLMFLQEQNERSKFDESKFERNSEKSFRTFPCEIFFFWFRKHRLETLHAGLARSL